MQKKKIMVFLLAAFLLMALAVAGCTREVENDNDLPVPGNGLENDLEEEPDGEEDEMEIEEVTLYFMEDTGTRFIIGQETRELADPTPKSIMNEWLEGPQGDELIRAIPEDTRLLDIKVEDNIAYVNLSSEVSGSYGHEGEQVAVYSMVNTLAQLDEVDAVQIMIEGEVRETLAGHEYIGEPLKPFN